MKINQYACISLTEDYQKKGDIPDCKDQWIILNKAQCIKHKLQEYEPIVGPGKLDSQNTDNQFTSQTPNSSSIFTIINDKLLIAFKQKILQYDRIVDLFSIDKYSTCLPQQQHTITSGNVISMHPNQNQLIVRTDNSIILYKFSNSNLSLQKTYNYSNVKQLNIQDNVLFLCLPDKLIAINLINQTEQILKVDNKIAAGYLKDQEYYYICENSNLIKSLQKNYELNIPISIEIKALFVINKFICVCGYETKYEPLDDEDDEPATYSSHIFWFDMTCNQPIQEMCHREVDLITETNNKGDFGIKQLSDLYIVYGSNLRLATFWTLDRLCQQAKKYENSDDKLELLQHSEIRGLVTYKSNPFIGFGMNQINFRSIERNPNICILDKKGGLQMYEFFNFKTIVEYQINQSIPQNSIFQNNSSLFKDSQLLNSKIQRQQKVYEDIKFTLIESDKKEMNIIANPPFNLQLITQNKDAQMVYGKGRINYEFRLYQKQNPSANLVIDYQHFQIIGHEREIIIITPIIIQQILSEQQQQTKLQIQKITQNPGEIINRLCLFQNKILIQTNICLYLVNYQDDQWNISLLLNYNHIKRVQVLDQYLLLTIFQDGIQQILYEYKKDCLQQKVQYNSDAGCLFQLNGQIQLLLIVDDQLYVLKDFLTKQLIQIDVKITQSKEYFITQLHDNHIYLSFADIDEYEFNHYVLNYDAERNQALQEQHLNDLLSNLNINDHLTQITNFDWNITTINTPKAKIIVIFPNGIQEGFILQVCGNDLRTIENEKGEPIQLSSYTHIVKGISILKYILPSEEKLGDKPGLCKAKQEQKEFQYQMQPSILIYEFDEKSSLTIHRLLLIKLDQLNDSTPLLQIVEDQPLKQKQQKTPDKLFNENIKQISKQQQQQPQPSPQPPKRITQITHQLYEFCKQSMKQLNGEEDDVIQMKPYFSIFTSQNELDQLSAKYTQILNARQIMRQKTKENSSVQDFCLLRKSFDIPKFQFSYEEIQTTLSQLSRVEEQFSWICNFVINTLQMNPIKRNKITFGEFEFPSIQHITPKTQMSNQKAKIGRKIIFTEFCDEQPQVDIQMAFIQKLCQARKSNVKYIQLRTDTNKEINDLTFPVNVMSTTSFGIPFQRLPKQPQSDNIDENEDKIFNFKAPVEICNNKDKKITTFQTQFKDLSIDSQKKNLKLSQNNDNDQVQEKKSEVNQQQQYTDFSNKSLTRTRGGILNQELDNELINPLKSDVQIASGINMVESQIIDRSKSKDNNKQQIGQPLKTETKSLFGQQNQNNIGLFKDLTLEDKSNQQVQNTNVSKQNLNENNKNNQDKLFNNAQGAGTSLFSSIIPNAESSASFLGIKNDDKESSISFLGIKNDNKESSTGLFGNKNDNKESSTGLFGNKINNNKESSTSFFGIKNDNKESATNFLGIKIDNKDNTQNEQNKELSQQLNQQKESQAPQQNQQKSEKQLENQTLKTSTPTPVSQPNLTSTLTSTPVLAQTQNLSLFQPGQTTGNQAASINPTQQQTQNQTQAPSTQLGSQMFAQGQQSLNFDSYPQAQSNSLFLNTGNQTSQGLSNSFGFQQQNQTGTFLNINTSGFGSTSSIFDQKNTAPPVQQKITFTSLASQNLPLSMGGFFGQTNPTNQGGFIQTTQMNLGFDPAQEKPRK